MHDVAEVARSDGRSVPDLTREALEFYAMLHPAARRSLRILAGGGQEDRDALAHVVSRAIVQHGADVARRIGTEAAQRTYADRMFASEDGIVEEAVRLARSARSAPG